MKILSDWQTGNPPMPGLYLTRINGTDTLEAMMRWDGEQWWWLHGKAWPTRAAPLEFRGLAFDSSKAEETEDAETGVVGWFIPGDGPSRQPWLKAKR